MRLRRYGIFILIFASLFLTNLRTSRATVLSSPSFELDGANTSSLAASSPTIWTDLVSDTTALTIASGSTRSTDGGGSITVAPDGTTGAALGATSVASNYNISGDLSLFMWVKATSWNATWNIVASRWFADTLGTSAGKDFHFSIKTNGSAHNLNLHTISVADAWGSLNLSTSKWYLIGFTLSSSGELKFYVNGQQDGNTITGAAHTRQNDTLLWVGDRRNCACSINGFIGKFRMWNSVLTSSQVAADYRNEAASFGYSTSTTISLTTNSSKYRTINNLTATVPQAGTVTFYEKGKYIRGCRNVAAASTTAVCAWKPNAHGQTSLSATYTPTDLSYLSSSASLTPVVSSRTASR